MVTYIQGWAFISRYEQADVARYLMPLKSRPCQGEVYTLVKQRRTNSFTGHPSFSFYITIHLLDQILSAETWPASTPLVTQGDGLFEFPVPSRPHQLRRYRGVYYAYMYQVTYAYPGFPDAA
jgi:hypothetical protein